MKLGEFQASAEDARIRAHAAEAQAEEANSLKAVAEAAYASALEELAAMRSSRSWRVTAPLRVIDAFARRRLRDAVTESGLSDELVMRLRNLWRSLRRR